MAELKGLSFPIRFGARGSLTTTTGSDKIKENIKAIVLTSVGERVMNPTVGTHSYEYVFRNMTEQQQSLLKHQLRLGIEAGETRVTVMDIEVAQKDRGGQFLLNITFKLDTETEFENLVVFV